MDLQPAPLFTDLAGMPPGGVAHWLRADDGVRIRIGHWCPPDARGTLILGPGRTEYIEKYGHIAEMLMQRGYATVVIDWRGQGLADRLLEDRRIGHVEVYTDYQRDLKAVFAAVAQLGLPRPLHLLGHSMAGPTVLRAVMEGADVASCVFTGPMFGITMSPLLRPVAWAFAVGGPMLGFPEALPPSTQIENYVMTSPFEGNTLTTDPEMFKRMQDHLGAHPELGLGGPSLVWLREALSESYALSKRPSPQTPAITFLGTEEKINDPRRIRARMADWTNGELDLVQGAEHEVLMEKPEIRTRAVDKMVTLFDRSAR